MNKKWETKEPYYLKKLLKYRTQKEIDTWIKKNPPPKDWQAGKYGWAFTEMMIF